MTKDQAIKKVQKLLKLAESSNPNEAALAAIRAKEILSKYNIQAIEIEKETNKVNFVKEYVVIVGRVENWMTQLANAAGSLYNCENYIAHKPGVGEFFLFMGEEASAKVASYVLEFLINRILDITQKAWENQWKPKEEAEWVDITQWLQMGTFNLTPGTNRKLFEESYKVGIMCALIDKLEKMKKAMTRPSSQENALVLYVKDAVQEYVKEKYGEPSKKDYPPPEVDSYAMAKAYEDGRNIQINPALTTKGETNG